MSRDFGEKRSLTTEHIRSLNFTPNPGIAHTRQQSLRMVLPSARDSSPGRVNCTPELARRPPMIRLKRKYAVNAST